MSFRPELRVLSDEQVHDIHQAALEILWNTGVLVKAPAARDLLRQAGAWVDADTMVCRIPGYIVEEALKRAPSSFTVYARNPKNDVHVSTRTLHYEPMIGRLNCYDYATGIARRTTLEDVGHLVKLADHLPNYHLLHSGAIMPQIDGVPIRATHVHGYLASVRNSSKVIKATSRERILAERPQPHAGIAPGRGRDHEPGDQTPGGPRRKRPALGGRRSGSRRRLPLFRRNEDTARGRHGVPRSGTLPDGLLPRRLRSRRLR